MIGLLVFCCATIAYYLLVSLPTKKAEEKAAAAEEKKAKEEEEAKAKKNTPDSLDNPDTQGSAIIPPAVPPRLFPAPPKGAVEFGGMFGYGTPKNYNNPLTDGLNCPSKFTATKILGYTGIDWTLFYCSRIINNPDTWVPDENSLVLGGMMGHTLYKNPVTNNYTCPSKFTENVAYGKVNVDNSIAYCAVKYDDL